MTCNITGQSCYFRQLPYVISARTGTQCYGDCVIEFFLFWDPFLTGFQLMCTRSTRVFIGWSHCVTNWSRNLRILYHFHSKVLTCPRCVQINLPKYFSYSLFATGYLSLLRTYWTLPVTMVAAHTIANWLCSDTGHFYLAVVMCFWILPYMLDILVLPEM